MRDTSAAPLAFPSIRQTRSSADTSGTRPPASETLLPTAALAPASPHAGRVCCNARAQRVTACGARVLQRLNARAQRVTACGARVLPRRASWQALPTSRLRSEVRTSAARPAAASCRARAGRPRYPAARRAVGGHRRARSWRPRIAAAMAQMAVRGKNYMNAVQKKGIRHRCRVARDTLVAKAPVTDATRSETHRRQVVAARAAATSW